MKFLKGSPTETNREQTAPTVSSDEQQALNAILHASMPSPFAKFGALFSGEEA